MACSIINKVRLYHIMQDEFRLFRELDIRKCRALSYSNGGHLLACVDSKMIRIFNAYTLEPIHDI